MRRLAIGATTAVAAVAVTGAAIAQISSGVPTANPAAGSPRT